MARSSPNPLDGVDRLIVDGNNLLHTLGRGRAGGERLPQAALIGRLRAAVPGGVSIELVFDGPPEPGMGTSRVAAGLVVRFGGRYSADRAIVRLLDEARAASGSARGADNILVVTDDRDLRVAVRDRGGRTARSAWLLARLERLEQRNAPVEEDSEEAADRPAWRPGRGATAKKGNPRRAPRRSADRSG